MICTKPIARHMICIKISSARIGASAFKTESFNDSIELLYSIRMLAQRTSGVGSGILRPAAVAEYDISAHQTYPASHVATVSL
jgi:hypothetical protein